MWKALVFAVMVSLPGPSVAPVEPIVGGPAPLFTAVDDRGVSHRLDEFRGRFVVLEWHSNDCPYAAKHYQSGHMQALQREWTAKGVVWLTLESSGAGLPGYMSAEQSRDWHTQHNSSPTAVLLDPTGTVGHLYRARTALHMFIIDPGGVLVYNGAIDDKRTTDVADIPGATNFVQRALGEALAGKTVTNSLNPPYGCAIQYASPQAGR